MTKMNHPHVTYQKSGQNNAPVSLYPLVSKRKAGLIVGELSESIYKTSWKRELMIAAALI